MTNNTFKVVLYSCINGQDNIIEDATVKKDVEGELILVAQHGEIIDFVGVKNL